MNKRHNKYPRLIVRFPQLQGGQYGTAELVAIRADLLELRLGGDFVQFDYDQAEELSEAVHAFLEPASDGERRRERREGERGEEEIEEIVEVVEEIVERGADSERPSEPPPPRRKRKGHVAT